MPTQTQTEVLELASTKEQNTISAITPPKYELSYEKPEEKKY
jgi:hypothetical protein